MKDYGGTGEEELYADLLNDDIVTLDDSLLCKTKTHNPSPVIMNFSQSETYARPRPPTQTAVPEVEALPCQGRRMKVKKQEQIDIGVVIFVVIIFVICLHVISWWW